MVIFWIGTMVSVILVEGFDPVAGFSLKMLVSHLTFRAGEGVCTDV